MRPAMEGPLRFEADFFRKSNNLTVTREKKIHSIQMRTVHLLLLLALALAAALAVSRAADWLLGCEALQVRRFRLQRPPRYARGQVEAVLRRHGGSILALDLKRLQARLLEIPEVAAVSLRRVLPDTVEIAFSLRRPFFLQERDGSFRLLDESGRELGRAAAAPPGLVAVRGGDEAVAAVAPFAGPLRPLAGRIEYVAWGEPRGIELKLRGLPEVFHPGDSDFSGRIGHYLRLRDRLAPGSAVARVDLRIPGRIYFELHEEQRGEP